MKRKLLTVLFTILATFVFIGLPILAATMGEPTAILTNLTQGQTAIGSTYGVGVEVNQDTFYAEDR